MLKNLRAAYDHDRISHRIAVAIAGAVAGGLTTRAINNLMDRVLSK